MTEQFYNLIVVMVIGVYTCDKTSKKCIHLCTHTHTYTQVLVKTDGVPALISWFSLCAMIMGALTIMESWVKGTQALFVLFL